MPSNYIHPSVRSNFPSNSNYNFHDIDHAIYDHHYDLFLHRLRRNNYQTQENNYFTDTYQYPIPANFTYDLRRSFTLSPGEDNLWLVFVHTERNVRVYAAQYVSIVGDQLQLFGDAAFGIHVSASLGALAVTAVSVPIDHIRSMGGEDVISL